jgi:hypothetical protein
MTISKFNLTPIENKLYTIDYSEWLAAGETITSVTAAVQQVTSPPLNITNINIAGNGTQVGFFAGGGVSGEIYEVEVVATTSLGQTRNDQIYFNIQRL